VHRGVNYLETPDEEETGQHCYVSNQIIVPYLNSSRLNLTLAPQGDLTPRAKRSHEGQHVFLSLQLPTPPCLQNQSHLTPGYYFLMTQGHLWLPTVLSRSVEAQGISNVKIAPACIMSIRNKADSLNYYAQLLR
jgi:hypothetical protein